MARYDVRIVLAASLLAAVGAASAEAQDFGKVVVFGDSSVDSGFYRQLSAPNGANLNPLWAAAVAAGAGAPTSRPGLMSSEALAGMFGLTAIPSNLAGGTNYATSGAKNVTENDLQTGGFRSANPTTSQINAYLAANGGRANSSALFLISSGVNDVSYAVGDSGNGPFPANARGYVLGAASSLANSVAALRNAGGQYFVVRGLPYSFPTGAANATERDLRLLYTQSLWANLAAAGVNFVPSDFNAVRLAIQANASQFGFQFTGTALNQVACTRPAGVTTAWALVCSSNPASPSTFVTPDADRTRLFADDQHLTTAGQKIVADYEYSLIVAPSQVSMLAENAVKTRSRLISNIQSQIETGQMQNGPLGLNVWATGDVSHLAIGNYNGFPEDPSQPRSLTGGFSFRPLAGVLLGAAISTEQNDPEFGGNRGGFRQRELSGSIYGAVATGSWWGNLVGTYGHLGYDVTRLVPTGIVVNTNASTTSGENWSAAVQAGYDLRAGNVKHGPVVGLNLQRVGVDGFTESGNFTSLAFGDQRRDSVISALGWRGSVELGAWQPFAQATWNHEFITDRDVTASLTTMTAPSWHMPAVATGSDWLHAEIGTRLKLGTNITALGSVSSDLLQRDIRTYGAQIGINIAF